MHTRASLPSIRKDLPKEFDGVPFPNYLDDFQAVLAIGRLPLLHIVTTVLRWVSTQPTQFQHPAVMGHGSRYQALHAFNSNNMEW